MLQGCTQFAGWSKQPLLAVANLLKWRKYAANTVITQEGYATPFLAIIKSGECHVMRKVEAWVDLGNGKKEKRTRQVEMGRLGSGESFGEISLINNEPMTCSVVTASDCEFAVIESEGLDELDSTTVQLIEQSSKRTFGHLGQQEIHEEYVKQTVGKEWTEFKHKVLLDVLNERGIRPGYGKWSC